MKMNLTELQLYLEMWHYDNRNYIEMLETRDETHNIVLMWQNDIIAMLELMQDLSNGLKLKEKLTWDDERALEKIKEYIDDFDYYCQGC